MGIQNTCPTIDCYEGKYVHTEAKLCVGNL